MGLRSTLLVGAVGTLALWLAPAAAWAGHCPDGHDAEDHEVQKGQTLSSIAIAQDVTQRSIERANPGLNPNLIRPGQKIRVCKPKAVTHKAARSCGGGRTVGEHTVASGDTLSKIAKRYGVDQSAIIKRNKVLKNDPNALRVGQTLTICADTVRAKASKACGYRTPIHTHRVLPGETAAQIAGRYGVVRKELYRLNSRLKANPNLIRPHDEIKVCPNIAPREQLRLDHAVQSGETFGTIARRYGLTRKELEGYQRGHLENTNSLRVGQKLVVYRDGKFVPGFGAVDDDNGVLKTGMQLPPGKHYVVKHPSLSWGTPDTIRLIQTAVSNYRGRAGGGPKVHVGDISKRGGGKFPPHASHQHGRDVDVGYVLSGKPAAETRFISANKNNLDLARTWKLIKSFLDTGQVKDIFMDRNIQKMLYEHAANSGVSRDSLDELFQYPRKRSHGLIRHSKGHVNHFHVRFF